jgi:hypothetical protein
MVPAEAADAPQPMGLVVLGKRPPFAEPSSVAPPVNPTPLLEVPPLASGAGARLAGLSARLEQVRPPMMWGDISDALRLEWWRHRVAAAAREQHVSSERALPRRPPDGSSRVSGNLILSVSRAERSGRGGAPDLMTWAPSPCSTACVTLW